MICKFVGWTRDDKGKVLNWHFKDICNTITSKVGRNGNTYPSVCISNNNSNKSMIAKIYPDGHPDLLGKKDPTHPVRYFDIRKLTPTECFRLMGVSDNDIEKINQSGLSKSACYKLAGNSIVVDCLYYIYRNIWLTEDEQPQTGDVMNLFDEPTFRVPLPKTINMVTLCSGYDSQCLAMERLVSDAKQKGYDVSFDLKAWSEFDPESRSALEKQPAVVAHNSLFPQFADRNVGDMTKADWSFLKGEDIDLLTYSTPCQSISQAGKRTGIKRDSGTRSSILWYTENAIRALRPKFLLQENVRALVNKVNVDDFKEWQKVCQDCGYTNYWTIMNAKDFGVSQNRERVFMLSVRNDLNLPTYRFPKPFRLDKAIVDILEEDVNESYFLKPESVVKFFEANEKAEDAGIHYLVTDHKLSDAEIAKVRGAEKS